MQASYNNTQDSKTESPFLSEVAYKEQDQNIRILVSNIFNYVADIIWSVLEYIDTKSQEELRNMFEYSDSEKEQLSDVEISPLNIEETMKNLEFDTDTANLALTCPSIPEKIIITDGADTIHMSITGRGRSNSMFSNIGEDSTLNEFSDRSIGASGINILSSYSYSAEFKTPTPEPDTEEWVTELVGE